MSSVIVLNNSHVVGNNNSQFKYNFPSGSYDVSDGCELSVSQIQIPYSWFNVSSNLGNNVFQYTIPVLNAVSFTGSIAGNVLSVTIAPATGKIIIGDVLSVGSSLSVTSYLTGSGGIGTYQLSSSFTQASVAMNGTHPTIYSVKLKDGFYTLQDINTALQASLKANYLFSYSTTAPGVVSGLSNPSIIYPISLTTNITLYANQFVLSFIPSANADLTTMYGAGYLWAQTFPTTISPLVAPQVIIPAGVTKSSTKLGNLIGFQSGTYPAAASTLVIANASINSFQLSISGNSLQAIPPFPALGSNVNSVLVHCNLIDNKVGFQSDILDCIPISSTFGSNINYLPICFNGIKVRPGKYSSIIITFTDGQGNTLQANDPNALITLILSISK